MLDSVKSLQQTLETVSNDSLLKESFDTAGKILTNTLLNNKKILVAGNGGSAAEAQHFVAEIVGRFKTERSGYSAITLSADTSIITAISNDYGYENVFGRQIEALGEQDDVLLILSTSGNSPNIIEALKVAKKNKIRTIALLGNDGGLARNLSDIDVTVPSTDTTRIQEVHLLLIHAWCEIIDKHLS